MSFLVTNNLGWEVVILPTCDTLFILDELVLSAFTSSYLSGSVLSSLFPCEVESFDEPSLLAVPLVDSLIAKNIIESFSLKLSVIDFSSRV